MSVTETASHPAAQADKDDEVLRVVRDVSVRHVPSTHISTGQVKLTPVTETAKPLTQGVIEQGRGFVEKWVSHSLPERTWVNETHGVPSLFVRIDGFVHESQLYPLEIEDRPAGMALAASLSRGFKNEWVRLRKEVIPPYCVVVSPNRGFLEDGMDGKTPVGDRGEPFKVLIRAEPEETDFYKYRSRSIGPVATEGWKGYGVPMGFWQEITASDENSLPYGQGFVAKPVQGSKSKDVHIYLPHKHVFGEGRGQGISNRNAVVRTLRRLGRMYLQPFHFPMRSGYPEVPHMMYRIFYVYDHRVKQWVCPGGSWLASNSLRIHGTQATLIGPLQIKS